MDSSFTLTIDWLAFTVLATNPQETMKVLGGDWSKAKGGFRGYPLVLDEGRRSARGRQTGHECASSSE
jgi:hypothetical protein